MTPPDTFATSPRTLQVLEALGVPVARALAAANVDDAGRCTTEQFFALWRAVEDLTDRRDLGLVLGTQVSERGYSVPSAAALHAPDLAAALRTLGRYKRLTCPEAVEVEIEDGEASIRFHWTLATSPVPRLLVDSAFASFVSLARRGAGVDPVRVELARRKADVRLLREQFRCDVRFAAPADRLVFAEAALSRPFVTANAEAFATLVPGLEAELVRRKAHSLRDDVRIAIARNICSGGRPTVTEVARRLRLSARTLQRRLGEEATSYQAQLDSVRRTSARRLLANTQLATTDIAFLLGFEEPNSFARAFRAWERTTPIRWRERVSRVEGP